MNREKEASFDSAKHEEINKSTSEAVSWVEKWKKTIDVVGWRRITGAGRRATVVRANEFETGLCIHVYMRDSVFLLFLLLLLIPLASFKCKNSRGKRIFSLAIERGIDLFSCATSGNGKEAFSRGAAEIQPWKAEDTRTRNSLHGSQRVACTCAERMMNICHDYSASNYGSIEIWESSTLIRLLDRRKCELRKVEGIE